MRTTKLQRCLVSCRGLASIYKGHYEIGLLWMFLGMPIAMWVGILFGLATAGIGLLFPILCWAALAVDAYNEKDRRHHHRALWADDEDEVQGLMIRALRTARLDDLAKIMKNGSTIGDR